MQINELARAKVNLCLHVTGQRDDGYHLLDSIVVFSDIGDLISIEPAQGFSLTIDGPFADGLDTGLDNLVLQAALQFGKSCEGAAITLTKNLPVASGIGGGSADAAATMRAISRMMAVPLPLDGGLSLGADVPVCMQSTPCRMAGIGDVITPLANFPSYHAVLVCPNAGVATSAVFSAIENKKNPPIYDLPVENMSPQNIGDFLLKQRNDLEKPSAGLNKDINLCLDQIKHQGAFLARMSGSGATCFGLFETEQASESAARNLAASNPNWWVKPCVLGA
jgi:4-diphosphocytidyl-2-C-methyl-D-erythritol kinase